MTLTYLKKVTKVAQTIIVVLSPLAMSSLEDIVKVDKNIHLEAVLFEHGLDEDERGEVRDGGDDARHVFICHLHQPAVLLL